MGPLALTDSVGIDVAVKVAHILHDAFGDRLPLPAWIDRLQEDGRLGAKNGRGFYRYRDGERTERSGPDSEVYELLGLHPVVETPDPERIVDRTILRMVDEAARCLSEGVVGSPGLLDLAMIFGTGFPPFRGGLVRWADQRGVGEVVSALERFATSIGERYAPSEALRRAAESGGFYAHDWNERR
jgi:3-hydroxyacyl-CoA dehydrogenase/enoyl-CoA hydratase/3-hydroxybutyryl-CoA epimerase